MKPLIAVLAIMVMFLMSCASAGRSLEQKTDKPSYEPRSVFVIIHPENYFSRFVKIYCEGMLMRTIRPLNMGRTEIVHIKDNAMRCNTLQFSVNDVWGGSVMYNGGTVHLVIDPVIIENSYIYIR